MMVSCRAVSGPLFLANLGLTVVLLVLSLVSGFRRARQAHYTFVLLTTIALVVAIVQAELFGRDYRFEALRLQVHLGFAFAALASLPGVTWSGIGLARGTVRRAIHRRWVYAFVGLTVGSVLTAGWMFLTAVRIAD